MRTIYLADYKSLSPEEVLPAQKDFYEHQRREALGSADWAAYMEAELCLAAINLAALTIENPTSFTEPAFILKMDSKDLYDLEKLRLKTEELRRMAGLKTSLLFGEA